MPVPMRCREEGEEITTRRCEAHNDEAAMSSNTLTVKGKVYSPWPRVEVCKENCDDAARADVVHGLLAVLYDSGRLSLAELGQVLDCELEDMAGDNKVNDCTATPRLEALCLSCATQLGNESDRFTADDDAGCIACAMITTQRRWVPCEPGQPTPGTDAAAIERVRLVRWMHSTGEFYRIGVAQDIEAGCVEKDEANPGWPRFCTACGGHWVDGVCEKCGGQR